jgi:16S rRNA (cytosine967-C5)-methyltransferase
MLEQVARTVRSGGRLLYSTCSLEPEENQEVVEGFIDRHRDFEFLDFGEIIESNPWLTGDAPFVDKGRLTIFPPCHQADGMFISLMRRV